MTMFLKKKFYILIVCKANVTRSIYMHAYMNKILNRFIFTKKIIIMSAGTNAVNGSPPHEVIRHVANINKLSINNFKSKQISSKMIKKANLILTMEDEQKLFIVNNFKNANHKTFKILEYKWNSEEKINENIPDPTGKTTNEYKEFINVAHNECERILDEVSRLN